MTVYTLENLDEFIEKVEAKVGEFSRRTAMKGFKGVTERSPVRTGRFKMSWNIATGNPNLRVQPPGNDNYGAPAKGTEVKAPTVKPGKDEYAKIYVTNNLDSDDSDSNVI